MKNKINRFSFLKQVLDTNAVEWNREIEYI